MRNIPNMGEIVLVEKYYYRIKDAREHHWSEMKLRTPRPGWMVGYRYLKDGTIDHGFDYEEPTIFYPKKQVPVILVCYWPTMKPVFVPLDGYKIAPDGEKPWPPKGSTHEKLEMREYYQKSPDDFPRDEKGRFKYI